MTVTFIAHSGFLVEWDAFYTLFDFWQGELPPLRQDKPLLVFVSHSHDDHFDKRIFRLPQRHHDVSFFLSHDIRLATRHWEELGVNREIASRVTRLRPDSVCAADGLTIRTIKSTDAGVAFLLSAEGRLVFHAGDLNRWHWADEGEGYCAAMAANYSRAVEALARDVQDEAADTGCPPVIDAAMFPLDPRMGDAFGLGAEQLMRTVPVRRLFPMHMWDKFDWIDRYRQEHPAEAENVVRIRRNGESFTF